MKTILEIEFKDAKEASQAAKILKETKSDDESLRAKIKVEAKKEKVTVIITATDFTALRALTTTTLRDLKVIIDGFKITQN